MKIRLLFPLLYLIITTAEKECKRDLMTSYGLSGLKTSSEKNNPLCHTIKKNCCSSHDILKIFDLVTTSLQPTLVSFYDKMTTSTKLLRKLHDSIQKVTHGEYSDEHQKTYCRQSKELFKTFKFEEMLEKLTVGYEKSLSTYKDTHYAFYCALCDYDAHTNIDLKSRKISLDSTTCMKQIRDNKDYIAALNVDLVDYFERLQNLLDCSFYEKSFEFPFLFEYQEGFRKSTQSCLEKFDEDSNEMIEQCVPFCAEMNIAGVSRHFEGDPGFVMKAVDYYENLVEEIVRKAKERAEMGKEFNPMDHLAVMNHDRPVRELKGLTLIKKRGKVSKVLHDVSNFVKRRKTAKRKILRKKKFTKYVHALKKKSHHIRRILETSKKGQSGLSAEKLAHYKNLYDEISCLFHPKSDEIFKRTTDPIDLSKFTRTYLYEQGLNPLNYLEGLNFDLNREEILKTIHGPQNHEKMEYVLVVLLDSVNKNQMDLINDELTRVYDFEVPDDFKQLREERDEVFDRAVMEPVEMVGVEGVVEDVEEEGVEEKVVEGVEQKKEGEESRILEDLTVRENDVEKFFGKGFEMGKDFHV